MAAAAAHGAAMIARLAEDDDNSLLFLSNDFCLMDVLGSLSSDLMNDASTAAQGLITSPQDFLFIAKNVEDSNQNPPDSLKTVSQASVKEKCKQRASPLPPSKQFSRTSWFSAGTPRDNALEHSLHSCDTLEPSSNESSYNLDDGANMTFLNSNKDWLDETQDFDTNQGSAPRGGNYKRIKKRKGTNIEKKKRFDFMGHKKKIASLLQYYILLKKNRGQLDHERNRLEKLSILLNSFVNNDDSQLSSCIHASSSITITVPPFAGKPMQGMEEFLKAKGIFRVANQILRTSNNWNISTFNVSSAAHDEVVTAEFKCCNASSRSASISGQIRCAFNNGLIDEASITWCE